MQGMIYRVEPWSGEIGAYCVFGRISQDNVILYHVKSGHLFICLSLSHLTQVAYTTKFIQFHYEGACYSLSSHNNLLFDYLYQQLAD